MIRCYNIEAKSELIQKLWKRLNKKIVELSDNS